MVSNCGASSAVSATAVSGLMLSSAAWALVLDGDRADAALGHLPGEAAELLGKPHVGFEPDRFLRRQRRHVERVADRARDQEIGHLLGDLQGDVLLRLGRRRAEMRRRDQVLVAEQHVLLGRLDGEDVERGAGDVA